MGSSSSASVASCTRTRTLQYNMVAQTTLVVFTIVLAATGVFVPEAGRELEEKDALLSVQNVVDVQESGNFVKRDAARDQTAGGKKGKRKKSKKNKTPKEKKSKAKTGRKKTSTNRKRSKRRGNNKNKNNKKKKVALKKKKGRRNNVKKSKRNVPEKGRMVSQRGQRKVKRTKQ